MLAFELPVAGKDMVDILLAILMVVGIDVYLYFGGEALDVFDKWPGITYAGKGKY